MEIGVVGHLTRLNHAEALAVEVGASVVSVDDGTLGCERNHRKVWEWLSRKSFDWAVVLEDDAVPVDGFRTQLTEALRVAPTPLVSLYLGRLRPPWAQDGISQAIEQLDGDWILGNHLLHAVGYAIRRDALDSLIRFPHTNTPIDQHISLWASHTANLAAYCYPSLVDHADIPTVVDHPDGQPRTPGRTAWKAAPHKTWSNRSVTMKV